MTGRASGLVAAILSVIGAGAAPAQGISKLVPIDVQNRVADMCVGRQPPNKGDIERVANSMVELVRRESEWNKLGPDGVHTIIQTSNTRFVVDRQAPQFKKLSDDQMKYIAEYGGALTAALKPVFGTKGKIGERQPIVRVNAARLMVGLGKSGYEELADLAVEILNNPDEIDAVKLFVLEALRHLFAVPMPDEPTKSVFKKADRERATIKALCDFATRKPTLSATATAEEIEGYRYVRREAIRALGNVRFRLVKTNKTIEARPSLELLKIAKGEDTIQPPPSTAERIEALVGYFRLDLSDRSENTDYAIFYLGLAVNDLATLFDNRIKPDPPKPGETPRAVDTVAWKLGGARLAAGLREWKTTWERENPVAKPDLIKFVGDFADKVAKGVFDPMATTNEQTRIDPAVMQEVGRMLGGYKYEGQTLYPNDAASTLKNPNAR